MPKIRALMFARDHARSLEFKASCSQQNLQLLVMLERVEYLS